ncbi:MAG: aminotransferase class III-fold pyridoxal phosphate-dependent enzyme [Anaerolineae bacterium]|nr:aminotransferase class III-fold pyridoxal phosphate-dependent enzyme [Anaerolineae bacterium]
MSINVFEKSRRQVIQASHYLAGGVSSNYRLNISPTPLVIDRAQGPFVFDIDGNQLIDYYLGMGPMILGHSPESVVMAVQKQVERGILYAGQSEIEYEAAELVCQMVPCAERIRFGSSGTEVVQAALRLARAATGRSTIIKFEGHYHGWLDNILWSVAPKTDQAGSENMPNRVPGTQGQDHLAGEHIEVFPWNSLDLLRERLSRRDVAAVIMEPVMCNTSAIHPASGYLEGVRTACTDAGTVLIFDEVITGFRVALGGAQQRLGVTPDLATFGKAIANGFPVACLAGRADLMDMLVSQNVMHGGTYNAQAVCMAATVATLKALSQPGVYACLNDYGQRLMTGLEHALLQAEIPHQIQGFPEIFHIAFGRSSPISDYRDTLSTDKARYVRFTTALLEHGVRALERGAWFISTTHTPDIVDETVDNVRGALASLT